MDNAPFDLTHAHRWFAVELNNRTWELLEMHDRTPEQTEQMVHAAHSACFHWLQVGTIIHHLRAQCLLTTMYARLEYIDTALRHAQKCLELSQQAPPDITPFDEATTLGAAALAYHVARHNERAIELHRKAIGIAGTFTDADERAVFDQWYGTL